MTCLCKSVKNSGWEWFECVGEAPDEMSAMIEESNSKPIVGLNFQGYHHYFKAIFASCACWKPKQGSSGSLLTVQCGSDRARAAAGVPNTRRRMRIASRACSRGVDRGYKKERKMLTIQHSSIERHQMSSSPPLRLDSSTACHMVLSSKTGP
jgi:hypothetical protein